MQSHSKKQLLFLKKNSSELIQHETRDSELDENQEYKYHPIDRLPTLSELLTLGNKFKPEYLLSCLIQAMKENENLKQENSNHLKEMIKLEQINSYIITAQQNRDKLITELTQENKNLKNSLVYYQNLKNNKKKLNVSTQNQPSISWITPIKPINDKKDSILPYLNSSINNSQTKRGSVRNVLKKKSIILNDGSVVIKEDLYSKNGTPLHLKDSPFNKVSNFLNTSQGKSAGRIREEKMTHEMILNMNVINQKDSFKSYAEINTIRFLQPILDEEDFFITYVTGSDFSSLITLYDNLYHLYNDHKTLYSLVFRLKTIIKACNSMTETLVLSEAMERIVDETCECLECDRASVFMLDEQKMELWTKAAKGTTNTIRIPMNKGIVGSVLTNGKSVNIMNAYADDRFNKEVDIKMNYKTNTILCIPIIDSRGRNIGVIQAINKLNGYFTKDDEGLLSILATLAGIVLRNSITYDEQLLFHNSLRHILKAGIELNSLLSFQNIIPKAENILKNAMNVDKARLFLVKKSEGDKIELIRYEENNQMQIFQGSCGIAGYTAKTGTVQNLSNAYNNPLFNGQIDIETSMPLIAMPICHPKIPSEVLAVIEILNTKGIQGLAAFHKSKINHQDYEILEFFSLQLAQTILNNKKWDEMKQGSISKDGES